MKLIQETVENIQILKEEKDGKKNLFLQGVFAQAEIANRNKRIYPISVLEPEINRYISEKVKNNSAVGELAHPNGPNINPDRICMKIIEINKEGNNFIGKAKVTSGPMGQIVSGLIEDGISFGVSTRALGSVKPLKEGISEVQNDLRLLAVDVVMDPSGPDCWVNGILEGREYIWEASSGTWAEYQADRFRKELQTQKVTTEQRIQEFAKFMELLGKRR